MFHSGLDPNGWTSSERWIRCPDRCPTSKRRPRRQFDDDFKTQAIRLVLDEGKSVGAVARDLDLTESGSAVGSSVLEPIVRGARPG
jgi:hypothetical protein